MDGKAEGSHSSSDGTCSFSWRSWSAVTGSTGVKDRERIIADVQSSHPHLSAPIAGQGRGGKGVYSPSVPCFAMIITDAFSAGLNFPRANSLIIVDQTWTHAKFEQILGRIQRLGQTRPIFIYVLIVVDTIDSGLRGVLANKSEWAGVIDHHSFRELVAAVNGMGSQSELEAETVDEEAEG